jgi:hypothetical protein
MISTDRWAMVPIALGMILLAAGASDSHEFVASARDEDWFLLVRADLELYMGMSLLCGLQPRWGRLLGTGRE